MHAKKQKKRPEYDPLTQLRVHLFNITNNQNKNNNLGIAIKKSNE